MDLIKIIDLIFWVFMIMLFVRILGSWIEEFRNHKIMHFLAFYTDPYLNIFRRLIPPAGTIDLSPIVAFLFLGVIEHTLKALVRFFFL